MIRFAECKQRFAVISPNIRLAFIATAAERMMPIFEKFWLGDYHPELATTIDLAWQKVEGGALEGTDEPDVALAAPRAYASLLTTGDAVDGVLGQNDISAPSARAGEAWLDAAVARAETWTALPTRAIFRDLGAFPPKW